MGMLRYLEKWDMIVFQGTGRGWTILTTLEFEWRKSTTAPPASTAATQHSTYLFVCFSLDFFLEYTIIGYRLTLSIDGSFPRVTLDFTRLGNHSCSFHAPLIPPVTCPQRTTVEDSEVFCDACLKIISETHLDSP